MNKNIGDMTERELKELLEKLKQCDDFHNRCDFLMEHSEITYMLDYITDLQQENKKYKEVINKAIDFIDCHFKEMVADEEAQELKSILKEEE